MENKLLLSFSDGNSYLLNYYLLHKNQCETFYWSLLKDTIKYLTTVPRNESISKFTYFQPTKVNISRKLIKVHVKV